MRTETPEPPALKELREATQRLPAGQLEDPDAIMSLLTAAWSHFSGGSETSMEILKLGFPYPVLHLIPTSVRNARSRPSRREKDTLACGQIMIGVQFYEIHSTSLPR